MDENVLKNLNVCMKIINFIWVSVVNILIFKVSCEEIGSGYKHLL